MNFLECEDSLTQRVLVYGAPGTGKTELVGKLSEHYNLLWFDLEKGSITLKRLPKEWKARINLIQLPDSATFPIAVETMMKVTKGGKWNICQDHGKCNCMTCQKAKRPSEDINLSTLGPEWIVVIDGLKQFTLSAMANITLKQPDDYKMERDDWGGLKLLCDKFMSNLQVAPYNLVCISHEEELYTDQKKLNFDKVVPMLGSSNTARNVASYFDHIVYCTMKNKRFIAASGSDYSNMALTKSRTGIRLEDKKTPDDQPSLLEMFPMYKLPGFRNTVVVSVTEGVSSQTSVVEVVESKVVESKVVNTQVSEQQLTPGQIALANLRAKQASLASKQ